MKAKRVFVVHKFKVIWGSTLYVFPENKIMRFINYYLKMLGKMTRSFYAIATIFVKNIL